MLDKKYSLIFHIFEHLKNKNDSLKKVCNLTHTQFRTCFQNFSGRIEEKGKVLLYHLNLAVG